MQPASRSTYEARTPQVVNEADHRCLPRNAGISLIIQNHCRRIYPGVACQGQIPHYNLPAGRGVSVVGCGFNIEVGASAALRYQTSIATENCVEKTHLEVAVEAKVKTKMEVYMKKMIAYIAVWNVLLWSLAISYGMWSRRNDGLFFLRRVST